MSKGMDQTRVETLLKISCRLNHIVDLKEILQIIADAAAEFTQSEGSSILLFEEETQQ